jgi:hypothetical protein
MGTSQPLPLTDVEKARMRQWLENWHRVGPLLEQERRQRVAALTDDEAWRESQGLLQGWEPAMTGDAGEGLRLHQAVFGRWNRRGKR